MATRLDILRQEAILRKQVFFDPTYDPVFKKIFEKMAALIHFLNAILHFDKEHEITHVVPLKRSVKLSTPNDDNEAIRFDIHARTADGRFINIEMQRAEHDDFLDRIELYSSLLAINAKITMDSEASREFRDDHPYLMPMVYSVWLCNFDTPFCKSYREEFGIFRFSDIGNANSLPVYGKKRYIVVDITKFTSGEGNTMEQQWLELFKLMPTAKGIPANVDAVIKDVYERLLVGKSSKRFIAKVAKDMVDKREYRACLSTARRKGLEEGLEKGFEKGAEKERIKNEAVTNRRAEYLRSQNVSDDVISAMLAIK